VTASCYVPSRTMANRLFKVITRRQHNGTSENEMVVDPDSQPYGMMGVINPALARPRNNRSKKSFFNDDNLKSSPTPQQARKWQESIENVLSDPKGRAFFHKFLQNEYASENLDFWNSVKELKKNNPSGERLKKDVRQIHEQYLRDSAENLINVNNRLKGAIKDCLDDPGLEIFDEAQRVVYGLMKEGAYQRFIEESHIQTLIRGD